MERNLDKMGIVRYRETAPSLAYARIDGNTRHRIVCRALLPGASYEVEHAGMRDVVKAASCDDAVTKWLRVHAT